MSSRLSQIENYLQANLSLILRVFLAIIYLWFGILKLAGVSPAEQFVLDTLYFMPQPLTYNLLALWEISIGIMFLIPRFTRLTVGIFLLHISGTFLPLIIIPEQVFTTAPFVLTLKGQYIFKNLALIGCTLALLSKHKS